MPSAQIANILIVVMPRKSMAKKRKYPKQIGKSNKRRDEARLALPPGKRISKFGNIYYETRKNRTDLKNRI